MIKVALTGGIGSGKSEVERLLAERGALVVDADRLAREVVEPGTRGLAAVLAEFGPEVRAEDGSLDRAAMAALAFADPDARRRLEAIVHPLVGSRAEELLEQARREARDVVVYSVPLLVETAGARGRAPGERPGGFDVVVVVDAPAEVRVRRLVRDRGMSEDEVRARMAAQASDADRREVADVVLANDGTVEQLAAQVDVLWQDLSARARGRPPTS